MKNGPLALVSFLILLSPLLPALVDDPHWHGLGTMTFEAGAALLPGFLACSQAGGLLVEARRAWPVRLLLVLLVWSVLSLLMAPDKAFAAQGLLQLGCGILVCLAATLARAEAPRKFLLDALCSASLLTSFSGLALYLRGGQREAQGFYHDHQLYGAALLMPFSIMLAVSVSPVTPVRRVAARIAVVVSLVALALSQTRSSWLGAAVSVTLFAGLMLYAHTGERPRLQSRKVLSAAAVLCALGFLLFAAPQAAPVRARVRSLMVVRQGKEWSVEWRLATWRGALAMAEQRPLWGWGIGEYPALHYAFTGTGQNAVRVRRHWPNIEDEAHNSYLQIAVETGLPGLLLWLGVLGTAFVGGLKMVRFLPSRSLPQRCLIGCLAALAGQAVDAAANPGWQFGEVAVFFWVTLGLLVALCLGEPEQESVQAGRPRSAAGVCLLALAGSGGMLWLIWATARVLPAPMLGPVTPIPSNRVTR